jgi:hypothetical protein
MSSIHDLTHGPIAEVTVMILSVVLLAAIVFLGAWLFMTRARLVHARRQAEEVAAERDHVLTELVLSHNKLARLEEARPVADRLAVIADRLSAVRKAAERAEAVVAAREAKGQPRLTDDSRYEAISRMVDEALDEKRSWTAPTDRPGAGH